MKSLIIAEKPSVAKDIAKVLKCSKKGEGYFYNENYIVSWAVGHLVALCEPQDYNSNYKKWNMSTLPIIPDNIKLKPIKNTASQLKILSSLMKIETVKELICATDSGREGELIFRYIYTITKCKKPFKRLWISSMTDEAIKDGFKNLKDGAFYDNLYFSAKCRSEADWLVGINASRAFSIKFNSLLSIGRVQTPTLALIVERDKEIKEFEVKEYFEINVTLKTTDTNEQIFNSTFIDEKNNTKIFEKQLAQNILDDIKNENGTIFSVENETKKQPPPLLYDLTELQRDCNNKFSYSAQKTLNIAQSLYETKKAITYPRTDSRYLSSDMKSKIKPTLDKLNEISKYEKFLEPILNNDDLSITKRIVDDSKITDHHAIIPTISKINISSLTNDEKNVYDLIVRRFIAVFYPNYIYSITKITTKIKQYNFLSKGTAILQAGWTALNIADKKQKKDIEEILPNVLKGDLVINENAKILQKKTKPPAQYTEATLLSIMENAGRLVDDDDLKEQLKESGLGTPATRAAIIERLITVGYVKRIKKSIVPTEKAIKLINILPKELKSPETTGKWEKGLSSISKGNMKSDRFMNSINNYVNFLVNYAKNSNVDVIFEDTNYEKYKNSKKYKNLEKFGVCPKCKGDILENSKSFYCVNWKTGCKFNIWKNSIENYNIFLHKDLIKNLLENKKIENVKFMGQDKTEKFATLTLLDNGNILVNVNN